MIGRLADLVDRLKTSVDDLPVIAVGGGAFLVPDSLPGVSQVIKVAHAGVANAVGAAMSQVSGGSERFFYGVARENGDRRDARRRPRAGDRRRCAPETLTILDLEDTPMSYIPGDPLRVRVRVIGDLAA